MVDGRFHIRIGDFDGALYENIPVIFNTTGPTNTYYHDEVEFNLLWTAPEVLMENHFNLPAYRRGLMRMPRGKTKSADIYSFGIIMQELVFGQGPAFTAEFGVKHVNYYTVHLSENGRLFFKLLVILRKIDSSA
jgi:serine/threonine protein kinase